MSEPEPTQPIPPTHAPSRATRLVTFAIVVALAGVMVVVLRFTPLRAALESGFGPEWDHSLSPGDFALLLACGPILAFFLPRSIVYLLGGVMLGFWPGLLWAQVCTTIGSYALFLSVRLLGQDWARRTIATHPRVDRLTSGALGFWGVFWIRQLPFPNMVVNALLGLSPIPHWKFVVASFIAFLPEGIPAVLVGAGFRDFSVAKTVPLVLTAVACIWVVGRVLKALSARFAPAGAKPATGADLEPTPAGTLGSR